MESPVGELSRAKDSKMGEGSESGGYLLFTRINPEKQDLRWGC